MLGGKRKEGSVFYEDRLTCREHNSPVKREKNTLDVLDRGEVVRYTMCKLVLSY